MGIQHKLTSKAQVTVPKDVRATLGVAPGDLVCFETDSDGRVTLTKGDQSGGADARQKRIRAALEAVRGKYPNPNGMTTDEYMLWLRGDWKP